MKIALLFSGQLRTYKRCISNWQEGVFSHYDADAFFAVWDYVGTRKDDIGDTFKFWPGFKGSVKPAPLASMDISRIDQRDVLNTLYPAILKSKDHIRFFDSADHQQVADLQAPLQVGWEREGYQRQPSAIFPMFTTAWHQAFLISESYKLCNEMADISQYDVVIRLRPDAIFVGYPKFTVTDKIRIPFYQKDLPHDYLAYGPSKLMEQYCNLYKHLPELSEMGLAMNSESKRLRRRRRELSTFLMGHLPHGRESHEPVFHNSNEIGVEGHETHRFYFSQASIPIEAESNIRMSVVRYNSYAGIDDLAFTLTENFAKEWLANETI